MDTLDLAPRILRALRKARLTRPILVLQSSIPELCRRTKLSHEDVESVVKAVSKTIAPASVTALDLYKKNCSEQHNIQKLSIGCPILDSNLGGGILSQGITEISGESSSGKTQVCLQLCLTVQLPYEHGGLNGAAVFISSEGVFPTKRLQQMIPEFEEKYKNILEPQKSVGDNIYIEHATDVEALMNLIKTRLPTLLEKKNVKLIIIDSIAALVRVEYTSEEMSYRSKVINTIGARLKGFSYKNRVPVVCVNQVSCVTSASNNSNQEVIIPSLGLTWSNLLTVRLMLSKPFLGYQECPDHMSNNPQRQLKIIFAPHLPNKTCSFIIDSKGVHGYVD